MDAKTIDALDREFEIKVGELEPKVNLDELVWPFRRGHRCTRIIR